MRFCLAVRLLPPPRILKSKFRRFCYVQVDLRFVNFRYLRVQQQVSVDSAPFGRLFGVYKVYKTKFTTISAKNDLNYTFYDEHTNV